MAATPEDVKRAYRGIAAHYYDQEEPMSSILPGDDARKDIPITTGLLDYFPAALAEVAKVSKAGNDKWNPGEPLHHARGKSMNHADSMGRHLLERGGIDEETGQRHSAELAWRALANLQQELEDEGLAPLARGARLPDPATQEPEHGRAVALGYKAELGFNERFHEACTVAQAKGYRVVDYRLPQEGEEFVSGAGENPVYLDHQGQGIVMKQQYPGAINLPRYIVEPA